MICPQCGEVTAPGPLDNRFVVQSRGSLIVRLIRRFGRRIDSAAGQGGS
jgi:hypothetical protein